RSQGPLHGAAHRAGGRLRPRDRHRRRLDLRGAGGSVPMRHGPRHRQDRHLGRHPPQASKAHPRRIRIDEKAFADRRGERPDGAASPQNRGGSPGRMSANGQRLSLEGRDYGVITALLLDDSVSEVMVNGRDQIYVERQGKLVRAEAAFASDEDLIRVIREIAAFVGRRIDEESPMVDARLPDGSRVNAIIPPLAIDGPSLTIRQFAKDPYTVQDLITFGSLTAEAAGFLEACVKAHFNILVAGGTGSGKTTTLNVLSSFIPDTERVVTIEDAAELQLRQPHKVRLESRPARIDGTGRISIRELVVNALRMRPDRIVIGECRSGEALDMLQAMNTGHDGSLTTIHANSPRDTLARLETL